MKKFTSSCLALLAALGSTAALAQVNTPPLTGAAPRAPSAPPLPVGLYVSVTNGAISLSNKGGSSNFTAGQFGYTATPTQPPVLVPKNPAIQFAPPPAFSSNKPPSNTGASNKAAAVDCEVR
jgi:hypothetical protein